MVHSPLLTPEQWVSERWVRGNRCYVAEVTQTLFGEWVLVKAWGSTTSKLGNSLSELATSYDHALLLLEQVRKKRLSRKYQPSIGR